MNRRSSSCPYEDAVLEALRAGDGPTMLGPDLSKHVNGCDTCAAAADLAHAFRADLECATGEATPPPSGVVWWQLQRRLQRDAARTATRPVAMVQALAVACLCGLLAGLGGLVWGWIQPWVTWVGAQVSSVPALTLDLVSRPLWLSTGVTLAVVALAVLAPVAAVLALIDE